MARNRPLHIIQLEVSVPCFLVESACRCYTRACMQSVLPSMYIQVCVCVCDCDCADACVQANTSSSNIPISHTILPQQSVATNEQKSATTCLVPCDRHRRPPLHHAWHRQRQNAPPSACSAFHGHKLAPCFPTPLNCAPTFVTPSPSLHQHSTYPAPHLCYLVASRTQITPLSTHT